MTDRDVLASAIRDTVTQGSFVKPWDHLQECERSRWREAAVVAHRVLGEMTERGAVFRSDKPPAAMPRSRIFRMIHKVTQ